MDNIQNSLDKNDKLKRIAIISNQIEHQWFCYLTKRNRCSLVTFCDIHTLASFVCTLICYILNMISYIEDNTPHALWVHLDLAMVKLRRLNEFKSHTTQRENLGKQKIENHAENKIFKNRML